MFTINTLNNFELYELKGTKDKDRFILYYGPYYEAGRLRLNKSDKLYIDLSINDLINKKYSFSDILNWLVETFGLVYYDVEKVVINDVEYQNPHYIYMCIMIDEYNCYTNYLNSKNATWTEKSEKNCTTLNANFNKRNEELVFKYNGSISYTNESKPSNKYYKLKASYDIKNDKYEISFKTTEKSGQYKFFKISDSKDSISFNENDNIYNYKKDEGVVIYSGLKRLKNNINMFVNTTVTDNKVIKSNVEFLLLEKDSSYKILIDDNITISYHENNDCKVLYSAELNDNLNLSLLDDLIERLVSEYMSSLDLDLNSDLLKHSNIDNAYSSCLNVLRQIAGDIKLPYLKSLVKNSINQNIKKSKNKKLL